MLPTFARDPRVALVAAADPRAQARARFTADFAGKTYETVASLCADRRMGRGAPDRGCLHGVAHIRERRLRFAHLWGLWSFRFRRVSGLDRRNGAGEGAVRAQAADLRERRRGERLQERAQLWRR